MGFVRRWVCVLLAAILVASVMGSSPIAAQDEPGEPDDQVVAEPFEVDEIGDEPIVETAVRAGAPQQDLVIPEPPPSEESKRPGWLPTITVGTPEAGEVIQVGEAPVSVRLDAEDAANFDNVSVNVLDRGYAGQLSPFGAAVSVGFADDAGRTVTPRSPFDLTLDLTDVNLGDSGDVQQRLSVTRYEGCELFEPDVAELEDTEIDPESVLPRVGTVVSFV